MNPIIWISVVVLACLPNLVVGQTQPSDQSTPPAPAEIKALLDRFAYSTDMLDRSELESMRQLIAKGTATVPVLEQLFKQSTNDEYQKKIISVLFAIKGAERDAVRIVVEGLSKEPATWQRKSWVDQALLRLPEVDPDKARWASLRLLETESRGLQLTALRILERLGKPQDLEPLKRFLASRQQYPAPDGPAISAQESIDAITKRHVSEVGGKMGDEDKRQVGTKLRATSSPAQALAETQADDNRFGLSGGNWLWAIGGLVLVALIALWIASRFR